VCAQDERVEIATSKVDGPYGCWMHTEGRSDELAGLVDVVWHFDGRTTFPRERVFPNGLLEIIVQLDGPFREIRGRTADPFPVTCVNGLQTNSFVIEAPARPCRVLGIRLTPAGAYALLNTPLVDMRDITIDLADVAGRCAVELTERCQAAATGDERVRIALHWVGARVARGVRVDPAIGWMASQIDRRNGSVSIADLRERIGYSKTRLVDAFRRQIGLSPKTYARVIRFRRVLRLLHSGAGSLSDVAIDAGLYDQPHLNAEFKELSGFTPTEFLEALRYSPTSLAES
jgi:AraC-like DNA-binding protein